VRHGVMRGLITNEAGAGTSPMAHAVSDAPSVERGFMGIVEVLVDTVILCGMTAAVILISYGECSVWGENSVMMTLSAYSAVLGAWADYAMCAAVVLFGLAAVICQSFYALEALSYLTKKLPPRAQSAARRLFILFFALCAYLGAVAPPTFTWGLADLAIGLMTLINLPTVLLALEEIKRRTAEYFG
jgi:AGCS family alanine or glycine:cation symporter